MSEKDLDELLAGHALHALSPDDQTRLDEALAGDPALADRARRDEETAVFLADAVPEVAPPARIRDELLARIAAEPAPALSDEDAAPEPEAAARVRPMRRVWFTLAASIALVLAVGIGVASIAQMLDRPEAVVALERIESADDAQSASAEVAGGGTLELHWSPSTGEAVVVADGVPVLDEGSQYELWYVRGETPIPAGVFDGGSDAPTLLEGEMAPGDVVAVTVEQEGGSPTGAPTTTPIVAVPSD